MSIAHFPLSINKVRKALPYILLFVVLLLVQVFLFDNLSISSLFEPLVYVAFIALLPMQTPVVAVLLCGLAMGVSMDFLMGVAGLNTIATLFVAFIRGMLLKIFCRREELRESGTPCVARLGARIFLRYLIALVVVHHAIFFLLEALSAAHLWHTLLRIAVSSAVTILFAWLIARIFTAQIEERT